MNYKYILIYNYIFDFFVLGLIRCRNYFYLLLFLIFVVWIFVEMLVFLLKKNKLIWILIINLMSMYLFSVVIVKLFCFMIFIFLWVFFFLVFFCFMIFIFLWVFFFCLEKNSYIILWNMICLYNCMIIF